MRLFQQNGNKRYKKAELKKGYRWYIEYAAYNPATEKQERIRETYNLNRIKDEKERQKEAEKIVKQINLRLPKGFPFQEITQTVIEKPVTETPPTAPINLLEILNAATKTEKAEKLSTLFLQLLTEAPKPTAPPEPTSKTTLLEGIEIAYGVKTNSSDSEGSHRTYKNHYDIFVRWVKDNNFQDLLLHEFTTKEAKLYMDYWMLEKEVKNNTYNNARGHIRAFFEELIDRELIKENPFGRIKRKKKNKKIRDRVEDFEVKAISDYYKEYHPWMYKALILMFYCWIRPIELSRLKFRHFDLKKGLIKFKGAETKNDDDGNITIPKAILKDFCNPDFAGNDGGLYVFGESLQPAKGKCGKNSMNNLHNKVLNELQMKRKGLSWYSWKDTGMSILGPQLNIHHMKKHARHSNLSITETYLHSIGEAMESIKNIETRYV